jgi:hypothetical protein
LGPLWRHEACLSTAASKIAALGGTTLHTLSGKERNRTMPRSSTLRLLAVAACIAGQGVQVSLIQAGPVVLVGAAVPASRRVTMEAIRHDTWDALLKRYVDGRGMVDYATWKASAADQQALDQYLAHLSSASLSAPASRAAQLAYWINAYNAVTVHGILREYPTTSIRQHTARLGGYNLWRDLQLLVEEQGYSLEQIEHQILRKMGEPRIHFAIVCASIGCPPLRNEAYVAPRLEAQLSANAQAFFADPSKFQYDAASRTLAVSPILKWFAEDFGPTQAEQLRRIAPFLPDAASRTLAESGMARLRFLDYDWGLNDRSANRPSKGR